MNQDQVKELLEKPDPATPEFEVTFPLEGEG